MKFKILTTVILVMSWAGAKAEGHQPLQVDFNKMIEDVNRDGNKLHEQISRHIQNYENDQQWDKNDAASAGKKQRKLVNAVEDSDVQ